MGYRPSPLCAAGWAGLHQARLGQPSLSRHPWRCWLRDVEMAKQNHRVRHPPKTNPLGWLVNRGGGSVQTALAPIPPSAHSPTGKTQQAEVLCEAKVHDAQHLRPPKWLQRERGGCLTANRCRHPPLGSLRFFVVCSRPSRLLRPTAYAPYVAVCRWPRHHLAFGAAGRQASDLQVRERGYHLPCQACHPSRQHSPGGEVFGSYFSW